MVNSPNLKEPDISSNIPTPPKGTGISRRLLIALASIVVFVALLFLFFLHHYAPQAQNIKQGGDQGNLDSDTAGMVIQKIENEQNGINGTSKPIVISAADQQPKNNEKDRKEENFDQGTDTGKIPVSSDSELKEAQDAPISVYENTQMMAENTPLSVQTASGNGSGGVAISGNNDSAYLGQNNQDEKVAFLKNANSRNDRIQSSLQSPITNYEVKAGTIIPATLVTGINSDLPGPIFAKVRSDVFDTATGNFLLIPQGTTLVGTYDSQVTYGQSRVLIAWSRLVFPNGDSFDLEGMPGADLQGMAGLHDLVNNHYWRLFGSALMMSAFGAAGQMSQPQNNTGTLTTQQLLYAAIGQQMSETGAQLMAKNMNIQPTNEIRLGTNFNVLLTRDMVLPSPYHF